MSDLARHRTERYHAAAERMTAAIREGRRDVALGIVLEMAETDRVEPHVHPEWRIGAWYEVESVGATPDARLASEDMTERLAGFVAMWRSSFPTTIRGEYMGRGAKALNGFWRYFTMADGRTAAFIDSDVLSAREITGGNDA